MTNLADAKYSELKAQGFTGPVQQMELSYFRSKLSPAVVYTYNDGKRRWLKSLVPTATGTVNDLEMAYVTSLGYTTGALPDRVLRAVFDGLYYPV